jgi:chromosome segregation ATPase
MSRDEFSSGEHIADRREREAIAEQAKRNAPLGHSKDCDGTDCGTMSAPLTREQLAIGQAKLNAHTLNAHLSQCSAEKSKLHDRIRDLEAHVEKLTAEVIDVRRERAAARCALRQMKDDFSEAIVLIKSGEDGEWVSLLDLYNEGRFRGVCPTCQELKCTGCTPRNADPFTVRRLEDTFAHWDRSTR